jgi:hypothetical protein
MATAAGRMATAAGRMATAAGRMATVAGRMATVAAPMAAMVQDATVQDATAAITGGAAEAGVTAEVGAIQVMVGVGDSAGDGHTGMGIHMAMALGGDTRILITIRTTIRIVLLATTALMTGTTILHHQMPGHKARLIRRLLREHPRSQDLRTIHPVMVRMMIRTVPFFPLIG